MDLRVCSRFTVQCIVVACLLTVSPLGAGGDGEKSDSKRWRYFFREAQFDRLLLDLAREHPPKSLILRGATVLNLEGDFALPDHAVVVENGSITAVAPSKDVPPRTGSLDVDLSGKFLAPGLVDMHVHTLTTSGHYLLDLVNGVTSVREMCGFKWLLSRREQARKNRLLVPNLYLTGTILNGSEMEWYAIAVNDPEKARALVREQKAAGYDFIKVHNVLRPRVYDAIADESKKLGIDLVGHIPHDISLAKAIQSGQRTFEHLKGYYSDRTLELSKEDRVSLTKGAEVWNCPTLYTYRSGLRGDDVKKLLKSEEARYLSRDEREEWQAASIESGGENHRKIREQSLRILKELEPIHPKLLVGTDSGGGYPMMVPGFAVHEEMRLLVEAGLSPSECLLAATSNAAQAMRRENEFGTVKPGLRADLLVIDADPRQDVSSLSRISGVSVRGIWLDRATLESVRERVRSVFADDQGIADGQVPTSEQVEKLLASVTQLEKEGAIQMDHNLRELRELLIKAKYSTAAVDALWAARKSS